MNLSQAKDILIRYGEIVDRKNFSPGTSGNISMRFEDKVLITATASSNGSLTYDDLVLIDFEGNLVEGSRKASSEKFLHLEYYRKRKDINAIIHVHPPFLSSFAVARIALDEPLMAENVFYFGKIPLADYALPSTHKLVEYTAKYFDEYNAVLMANHGFIVGDVDMHQAYLKLELAESYAQVVINSKILGGAVPLTQKEVEDINSLKS